MTSPAMVRDTLTMTREAYARLCALGINKSAYMEGLLREALGMGPRPVPTRGQYAKGESGRHRKRCEQPCVAKVRANRGRGASGCV